MLFEATVIKVLPKVGGVRVRFRDLVPSGVGVNDFVRVLQRRMSKGGGATLDLPEEGEHGIVGMMAGGTYVWLGSTPLLDGNQVDPTPGLAFYRHRSGLTVQARDNGDFELLHPSGCRLTLGVSAGPLPALQKTSRTYPTGGETPILEIAHPSGTTLTIDASGKVKVTGISDLELDAAGTLSETAANIVLTGNATLNGRPIATVNP